ncbi:MAG TPA: hypothetical protein VN794_23555 [Methylomirabilota bacterium]|jgi:outer membrane biosynthesis protein TonB|nr:hypothetical protein [Methylomirabilota bacterium]
MESPKPHIRKQRCSRAGFGSLLLCAAAVWLLAFPVRAGAQPADEFFHGGAQSYIQGQKEKAKEQVTSGLKQFPEDAKLNAMAVLLQKQEEKRQQQQQSQDQQQKDQSQDKQQSQQSESDQQQSQKDQEKKSQDQKKQEEKEQGKPDQKQDQQPDQKPDEKKDEQQKSAENAGKPGEPSTEQGDEQAQGIPGQMSPEQAQQLLDAQKTQEKLLPAKPEAKAAARNRRLRDW